MTEQNNRKLLYSLPEYRYIQNRKRRKFLEAILVDKLAPTTAGKLLGLNSYRESRHGEVVNCTKAFREKAEPRAEIIAFWQGVFDLDYGPGVKSAAEEDRRQPLPDPEASRPILDEINRRYEEKKAAFEATTCNGCGIAIPIGGSRHASGVDTLCENCSTIKSFTGVTPQPGEPIHRPSLPADSQIKFSNAIREFELRTQAPTT